MCAVAGPSLFGPAHKSGRQQDVNGARNGSNTVLNNKHQAGKGRSTPPNQATPALNLYAKLTQPEIDALNLAGQTMTPPIDQYVTKPLPAEPYAPSSAVQHVNPYALLSLMQDSSGKAITAAAGGASFGNAEGVATAIAGGAVGGAVGGVAGRAVGGGIGGVAGGAVDGGLGGVPTTPGHQKMVSWSDLEIDFEAVKAAQMKKAYGPADVKPSQEAALAGSDDGPPNPPRQKASFVQLLAVCMSIVPALL